MTKKMPEQKPGRSDSTIKTPGEFLAAVRARWGIDQFDVDLAADENNVGAKRIITPEEDSFSVDWRKLHGNLWLNPPFSRIEPWAKKCAETSELFPADHPIFFLVPASTGSRWFQKYVFGKARVYLLAPRINFDGRGPYPKDCILAVYGELPSIEIWNWK